MASGRRVADALRSLVNARALQIDWTRVLHETMIWKEKERSRIRAVQMNNLRSLSGVRRIDKVPNAQIRELCGVTKGLTKVFSGGSRMENERITKRVYVVECAGSRSVGQGGLIP